MSDKDHIVSKIDEILTVLSCPVSTQEVADGWTEESKRSWKEFFEELRKNLSSGVTLPPLNIPRGMDYWGIVRGDLLERAAHISNELRKLK